MEYIGKLVPMFHKYKYVLLVILIGVVLLMLPGSKDDDTQMPQQIQTAEKPDISKELAQILSQIEGAGKVEVMLTVSAGSETVYQSNEDHEMHSEASSWKIETVTVTDADRNETGLIKQVLPEKYMGAIVVCQGADNAAVRLAVVEAVSCVTGLGADRISVWKMK